MTGLDSAQGGLGLLAAAGGLEELFYCYLNYRDGEKKAGERRGRRRGRRRERKREAVLPE